MLIVGLQEVWGLADLEANAAWDPTHHLQSSTVKIRGGGGRGERNDQYSKDCPWWTLLICLLRSSPSLGNKARHLWFG
jgi:hypothetical protein